ncbi:AGE family epimerase/isomerase [Octadecabacter sp. 1_MG-2023]|uniref:AGE family epimerase/isomerase n=1 Tax=unclassified Octadecabacter TaxID=196158 RepID=UPI001C08FE88|nr:MULTISPECIES: AGE family epimerase/isomerase [unclassified Octadecabacter]MBU2991592.1 AGE family epimerase/isomerase [Octadecabacter sp. B2R22]MDO6736119.1 AGE family epimerase/isomerase [Octadecabacter sp. 1_MG-2023]
MIKDAQYWSKWFWGSFFADWLARVQDDQGGVFDALDVEGKPDTTSGKTLLSQARTLFTLSHVALLSGDQGLVEIARKQAKFLDNFRKSPGLYRCKVNRNGSLTGNSGDEVARSYDQTFVILGLVTWNKVSPSIEVSTLINECWKALKTDLTDPASGLLLNDESGINTDPAQNPHMHLYEACLQAFRMTQDAMWLTYAADLRKVGLRYFMDESSGSITEFLTSDLEPLEGAAGQRREVGHQCEWAWLLLEEADLAKDTSLISAAERLIAFADKHGFAQDGDLKGAVFDAVSTSGLTVEDRFLLWPQTEAIKILSTLHKAGEPFAGDRAQRLLCLVFVRWFANRPYFCNQLDIGGNSLWDETLTRLMYHLVLALSEGSKAGLWPDVPAKILD